MHKALLGISKPGHSVIWVNEFIFSPMHYCLYKVGLLVGLVTTLL
jgi:hypothetical protein